MPHIKELKIHGFKSFARETSIPFKNTMNTIVGPNGSGKSCKYSTLVTLADGKQIMLGKLVEEQLKKTNEGEIKRLDDGAYVNGDNSIEIISLNKETMKVEKKVVSKFIKRDGEIIYKLRTRTGKEVEATGCHPVMVFNEGKVESSLIRDLSKGSLIASPRQINIEGVNNFDKDIARLLGYIIGDGYIAEDRIEFVNKDKEVLEDFRRIITEKFAVKMMERVDKNLPRIYIRDKSFVKYIRGLFNSDSKTSITSEQKSIPSLFFESNKEILSNLISGLYDTDGSARKDIAIIEFCTKNKNLADQLQGLLLRFGITCRIKKRLCCASNTENKTKREYFYIYIYGSENLSRFLHSIPLKVRYKADTIRSFVEKQIEPNPNTDLLPQSVNFIIRDAVKDLGIKIKPIKKEYPSLCAYLDNRCAPSRKGVFGFISLFENKLAVLSSAYENLRLNHVNLIECMDELNISGWQASQQIGLNKTIIRNDWATHRSQAKPENLQKFYDFIKTSLALRIMRAVQSIRTLRALAHSDIYWDEIVSIEQEEKEPFVYDLTIEGNHNFIANNIFIHNSNVTDSICFVLGRMGSKSMRAKRLSNLIFAGTNQYKPAGEASVEMVFDNADKGFSLDNPEVSIKRILRKNGQGVYKINNEIKTRQEVLELLGQAGIDPNGFNIILQGEIDSFVKMTPEERRQVIEEVAGISIYEMRKKHSLNELEKTENKLKEASAILRERNSYLRNLEEERKQALHFQKLQEDIRSFKASISHRIINEKQEKVEELNESIAKEQEAIAKLNALIEKSQSETAVLNEKIKHITENIQKASGLEQERLNSEISDLRADLAGIGIKQQNYQSQLDDTIARKQEIEEMVRKSELEIAEIGKSRGKTIKKDLEVKKKQLEELEEEKRKFFMLKSTLATLISRAEDKQKSVQRLRIESDSIFNRIQQMESELSTRENLETQREKIILLRTRLKKLQEDLENFKKARNENEKTIAVLEKQIENHAKVQSQVSSLDTCPLCKTKITKDHVSHVVDEAEAEKEKCKNQIEELSSLIKETGKNLVKFSDDLKKEEEELSARIRDSQKLELINEKKDALRKFSEDIKLAEKEHQELIKKREVTETQLSEIKTSESNYDSLRLEVQELERHQESSLGMELTLKQREIERNRLLLKETARQIEEFTSLLNEVNEDAEEKQIALDEKNSQDMMLKEKFRKTLEEKNSHQEKIHFYERDMMHKSNEKHLSEERINNLKIERAQFLAQKEAVESESAEFKDAKIIRLPIEELRKRIEDTQATIIRIGTVNMKALEVYDDIKKEYEKVQERVNTVLGEKEEILKVIAEIDKKKKKAFSETLEQINLLFSRNFSQLSDKGIATLEPVDKEKLFDEGIEMLIKVGKGKYFDTHSLSGGEKSLISLALIFAIQEYKPYCFYIFDEIDAALDRRNSERLAGLLKKYVNKGQYIIITHNDSLITESPVIYGVSMQDKISKVVSLEV